ncbi:MAG: Major Facilitator Superfamily protein [Candidatus Bathyarchaeota archaeon BA1]|nr:MAG: Major Facilitator Superfamily protein [Candidatus Bathyarchaeota archaeon BA1]
MHEGKEKLCTKAFRNVLSLGLVSFFTDISSEMCFSILPTFILGLPGATRAVLGLIEGLAEALSYGLRAVSGVFSDRFRQRKGIVFVGYALSNAVKPLFSVAQTSIDALLIRVSDRIGKGVRTSPRDALLSESVSERRTGAAFGLHRTLDQLGAILGPVLASAFMLFLGLTMREVFWLSLIPGSVALLILLIFVEERVGKPSEEVRLLKGVKTVLSGRFPLLLLIVGLFSIGAFNFSFVLLRAKEVGVPEVFIPMVYAGINVAHTAIAIPAGLLSDKVGKEKVLIMGYGTFLLSALLLSLPLGNPLYIFFTALVYGAYMGIVETVQRAIIPGYARGDLRGTAYGLYYLVVGSSFLAANMAVGTLWEYVSLTTAITYSAMMSIIAIISMVIFLRQGKG